MKTSPHLTGGDEDFKQADWMRRKFLEFGLDKATVIPYEVLLSLPKDGEPSHVYLKEVASASEDWKGNLNVTYYLSDQKGSGWKLNVDVHNQKKSAATYNTIGILRGKEEPGPTSLFIFKFLIIIFAL